MKQASFSWTHTWAYWETMDSLLDLITIFIDLFCRIQSLQICLIHIQSGLLDVESLKEQIRLLKRYDCVNNKNKFIIQNVFQLVSTSHSSTSRHGLKCFLICICCSRTTFLEICNKTSIFWFWWSQILNSPCIEEQLIFPFFSFFLFVVKTVGSC